MLDGLFQRCLYFYFTSEVFIQSICLISYKHSVALSQYYMYVYILKGHYVVLEKQFKLTIAFLVDIMW